MISKLSTGIGSVPHIDSEKIVEFIFKNFSSDIPFWPQLVNLSFKENMYAQFSEGLPNIKISEKEQKIYFFTKDGIDSSLFYENIENLEYFKISQNYAEGFYKFLKYLEEKKLEFKFLKGQITGPITFGLKITDEYGKSSCYNEELREIIKIHLARKSKWQIEKMNKYCEKVILFIDEPYLSSVGSAFVQIERESIVENLNYLINEIKNSGAISGIHCCADTDWTILFETEVDIVSFDAYNYFEDFYIYSQHIKNFLKRGGILAFGIVPASNKILEEDINSLKEKLEKEKNLLEKENVYFDSQFIITPSCGVGSLQEEIAEKILLTTSLLLK
jgi:methionine synthase II (cobalamin-independent)